MLPTEVKAVRGTTWVMEKVERELIRFPTHIWGDKMYYGYDWEEHRCARCGEPLVHYEGEASWSDNYEVAEDEHYPCVIMGQFSPDGDPIRLAEHREHKFMVGEIPVDRDCQYAGGSCIS